MSVVKFAKKDEGVWRKDISKGRDAKIRYVGLGSRGEGVGVMVAETGGDIVLTGAS